MPTIPTTIPTTIPLHMGALHPFEQALTLLLAFGPFVLLGIVVWLRRREDAATPDEAARPADERQRPPVS